MLVLPTKVHQPIRTKMTYLVSQKLVHWVFPRALSLVNNVLKSVAMDEELKKVNVKTFNRETFNFFQDLEFAQEISVAVKCPKCLILLRDPIQLGCGHR